MNFVNMKVVKGSVIEGLVGTKFRLRVCTQAGDGMRSIVNRKTQFRRSVGSYMRSYSTIVAVINFPRSMRRMCFSKKGVLSDTGGNTCLVSVAAADPRVTRGVCRRNAGQNFRIVSTPIANKSAKTGTKALSVLINKRGRSCRTYVPLFRTVKAGVGCRNGTKYKRRYGLTGRVVVTKALSNIYRTLACTGRRKLSPRMFVGSITAKTTKDGRLSAFKPGVLGSSCTPKFFVGRFVGSVGLTLVRTGEGKLSLSMLDVILTGCRRLRRRKCKSLKARTLVGFCSRRRQGVRRWGVYR